MDQLIKTLPALIATAPASAELLEAAVIAAWNYSVGAGLREHTEPVRFAEKRFTVAVRDTVWQKQLEGMRGELRSRINAILRQPVVGLIEFKVEPDRLAPPQLSTGQSIAEKGPIPLELLSAASAIEDNHLRTSFLKAAASSLRRLENKRNANC